MNHSVHSLSLLKEMNDQDGVFERRFFFRAGSAALAGASLGVFRTEAQSRSEVERGEQQISNPGQENTTLLRENPNSNMPPPTDHGAIGPIWYSFDLTKKRVQPGGWTHEVTERELPTSKDLAGVNMRLTAGSFRELHWHTAGEWAYMLYGSARVTVLNPDGTVFIDDVNKGDLWFFPAGFPHSLQGLAPNGCEFLLVFDEDNFSEDSTFLLSEWMAHTPPDVLAKNCHLDAGDLARLPKQELYIFPADLPKSLDADKAAVGGKKVESKIQYTYPMSTIPPVKQNAGGEVRVVDSKNFAASKTVAAGLVTVKPGAMRELHWHPNASEWQFYIAGQARMTVFMPPGRARTMDFWANDVGYVPPVAGHYIENTGNTDLVFLEVFKASEFQEFTLNQWMRRLPPQLVSSHLKIDEASIQKIPADQADTIAGNKG